MFNFDRDKKIRQQIINHSNLDQHKKQILACNTPSYFIDVTQCTVEQAEKVLNCSNTLANEYKTQYALIDWNSETQDNKQHINQLITIMSGIMDWQWNKTAEIKTNQSSFRK